MEDSAAMGSSTSESLPEEPPFGPEEPIEQPVQEPEPDLEQEPPVEELPLEEPLSLPEDTLVTLVVDPLVVASPVPEAMPPHAEITIRGWFADTFNSLVASGSVRERTSESALQDLLKRLGLRS